MPVDAFGSDAIAAHPHARPLRAGAIATRFSAAFAACPHLFQG